MNYVLRYPALKGMVNFDLNTAFNDYVQGPPYICLSCIYESEIAGKMQEIDFD